MVVGAENLSPAWWAWKRWEKDVFRFGCNGPLFVEGVKRSSELGSVMKSGSVSLENTCLLCSLSGSL